MQSEGASPRKRFELDSDVLTLEECGQLATQAADETHCTPVPLSELDLDAIAAIVDEANNLGRLYGAVDTARRYAVFRLPESLSRAWSPTEEVLAMPWCWAGNFGTAITLSLRFKESNVTSMLFLAQDSDFFSVLEQGEFVAIFVKGGKVMAAHAINFTTPLARKVLKSHLRLSRESKPQIFRNDKAHFCEVLNSQKVYLKQQGKPADRLSVGWAKEFGQRCHAVKTMLDDPVVKTAIHNIANAETPIGRIVKQVSSNCQKLGVCIEILRDDNYELVEKPTLLLHQLSKLQDGFSEEAGLISFLLVSLLELAINFDAESECGRTVRWLKPNGQIGDLRLLPGAFPDGSDAIEYWPALKWSPPFMFGYGIAFCGEDFPISTSSLEKDLSLYPQAEDTEESLEHVDFLLKEAMADKRGTIPYEATVQLRIGQFAFVQLSEVGDDVYVTLRTTDGRVLGSIFSLDTASTYFELPQDLKCDSALRSRIEAAITLLLTAIIRDFFVVEYRERVFSEKRLGSRSKNAKAMQTQRIVYLPRIKYTHRPNLSASKDRLGQDERASHFVNPHIRKSASTSDYQRVLADRYNIFLPEGYTFVRPHERGRLKRETVYRSRSAMQSLFMESGPVGSSGENKWFQFERDVCSLMKKLGFQIEHIAAGKNGDKGIDILATKGNDID